MRQRLLHISCFCCFSLFFAGLLIEAAPPSPVYPNDSDVAESMMRAASAYVRDKQWSDAVEIYQKITAEHGEKAVRIPETLRTDTSYLEESRRWFNLREFITALLAQWPEEGRKAYRGKVDSQAAVIWDRANSAKVNRDSVKADLVRLASDFYLSSYGEKAIERLGDLAFQSGDFRSAAHWYRMLIRLPDEPAPERDVLELPPVYPDLKESDALVTAKLLLSFYASGQLEPSRLQSTLKAFSEKFGETAGTFAGRTGPISISLMKAISEDNLYLKPAPNENWPTFAGDPSRNRVVEDPIDIGARQWRVPLEPILPPRTIVTRGGRFGGPFGGGLIVRNQPNDSGRAVGNPLLAYHPVIVGDQIVVCSESRVIAYNLNEAPKPDGTVGPLWWQDLDKPENNRPGNQFFVSGTPRMTTTAHNGRLYARMGESGISLEFGNRMNASNAYISAFDLNNKGQVLWRVACSTIPLVQPDGNNAPALGSLEGAPVADDQHVYCVISLPGHQSSTYVAALKADSGEVQWVRYLFDAPNPFDLQAATMGIIAGHAHHLLTLVNDTLYYQSDNGAVASLETATGQIKWVTAYPRQEAGNSRTSGRRDLNPAIYSEGRVYVAPSDSPHLFALDASSGAILWKSAPLPDVVHLIGVAKGHVFATGDRVWTIEASSGKIIRSWPDTGSGYEAAGRGLLAGDYLYWPTASEIHILDQKNGLRSSRGSIRIRERFQTSGGNLALGDGFLVVAGTDTMHVFTQNTRLIRRFEQLIADNPDAPTPRYRLATAAENIGDTTKALQAYRDALRLSNPMERLDGQNMDSLIRDRLYRLLVKLASETKQPADALLLLDEATQTATDSLKKLAARMLVADILRQTGNPLKAFQEYVTVASHATAHERLWQMESNYEVNLAEQARRRLIDLWSDLPASDRESFEVETSRQLSERLSKPLDSSFAHFLNGLPPGKIASKGWLNLASNHLDLAGRLRALERIRESPAVDPNLVKEAQLLVKSQVAGDEQLAPPSDSNTLPTTRWTRKSEDSDLSFVVTRFYQTMLDSDTASPGSLAFCMSSKGTVSIFHKKSGEMGPELIRNAQLPIWAGLVQGRGLIFQNSQLTGFNPIDGKILWQVTLNENLTETPDNSPFVKSLTDSEQSEKSDESSRSWSAEWWMIQSRPGRLLIQNLDGHVWKIDLVTGEQLWHRISDSTGVASAFELGKYVLMRDGSAVLILDSESGEMLRSMDRSLGGSDWCREPLVWDNEHVVLALDRMHVAMLNLKTGTQDWTWKATEIQPHNGPPRFFRSGNHLVAIADGEILVRLDPESGKVLWKHGLGDTNHSLERRDVCLDSTHVYLIDPLEGSQVSGTKVRAFSLTDGSLAWQTNVIGSAVSWAILKPESSGQSGLWLLPDSEFNRRLVSGQILSAKPSDLGESQGNVSSGILPSVVELSPQTGRIRRRIVNRNHDSGIWAIADWSSGEIFWGTNRNGDLSLVEILPGESR